jgi:hypothetical protein
MPPSFCTHHLNAYGESPPFPLAVNVTAVPVVRGLDTLALRLAKVIAVPDEGGGGAAAGGVLVAAVTIKGRVPTP